MYTSVPVSLDPVATRGQNNYLSIIHRAPCKYCVPKNFYLRTFRVLSAMGVLGALSSVVNWPRREASPSPPSSAEAKNGRSCVSIASHALVEWSGMIFPARNLPEITELNHSTF